MANNVIPLHKLDNSQTEYFKPKRVRYSFGVKVFVLFLIIGLLTSLSGLVYFIVEGGV